MSKDCNFNFYLNDFDALWYCELSWQESSCYDVSVM